MTMWERPYAVMIAANPALQQYAGDPAFPQSVLANPAFLHRGGRGSLGFISQLGFGSNEPIFINTPQGSISFLP